MPPTPRAFPLPAPRLAVLLAILFATLATPAQTPEAGIARALATSRAGRLADLHYALSLTLAPHAATLPGHELLTFTLRPQTPETDLFLDFRDGTLTSATLNNTAIPTTLTNGHLRLPAAQLTPGPNRLELDFAARIAKAGAAITSYDDTADSAEYLYSLFVPMDASMAFPCFDQPDLKAHFTLTITHPTAWTVISNTAPTRIESLGAVSQTAFAETKPISTYLFAFAAGPWVNVHPTPGQPGVWVRKSQLARATPEVPQLQQITADGVAWLSGYFNQPFPFPKYDLVLIPGFPFGGMEHAGATFLREDGVLFRAAPTANDRFQRNILTLHELSHQWFGDLVTMRWFDDLWLKEGFAQYMAYRALDSLDPQSQPWKHFYESIKPAAYGIDETPGTTPIFQDIPNLLDAKSAYGAIVYQKAPSLLKQLEFRLGPDPFRDGLRLYLAQHAYANAQWSDLIDAFHTASGQDVRTWADAWILRRGMPEITINWTCAAGKLATLTLHQHDVLPDNFVWPISNQIQLGQLGEHGQRLRVDWNTPTAQLPAAIGQPCPTFIFANAGDEAYGRFLLDPTSEPAVQTLLLRQGDLSQPANRRAPLNPLLRSMLWGALWDNVHVAKSPPINYINLVLQNLPHEDDESLAAIQGSHATTALHFYTGPTTRATLAARLEAIATQRALNAPTPGLCIVSFRTLTYAAESPAARATLKDLLGGKLTLPGVALRPLDRWNLVATLIALNDPDAPLLYAAEAAHDQSGDAEKSAFAALAATPSAQVKRDYFAQYLLPLTSPAAKPEDWLTQSLRPFNSWNQSALTEPYLRQALDQLPAIKRDRKIFFLGAWLAAFLEGQFTPTAEATVQQWLAQPNLDPDLRRKVLENNDALQRTVKIRQTFPTP